MSETWQKVLIAAGGAVAVGAVAYYLLRDSEDTAESQDAAAPTAGGELSRDDVVTILTDMIGAQEEMKVRMKTLSKEMSSNKLSFEQIYEKVKAAQPEDPLEKSGLSMEAFDALLEKNQRNPEIMQMMSRLMGGPDPSGPQPVMTEKAKSITVGKINEIHSFMLEELQRFMKDFHALSNKSNYDIKTVSIASQAVLDAKVTAKFNLASEDLEGAILLNQPLLVKDDTFMTTHMEMQKTMQEALQMGEGGM